VGNFREQREVTRNKYKSDMSLPSAPSKPSKYFKSISTVGAGQDTQLRDWIQQEMMRENIIPDPTAHVKKGGHGGKDSPHDSDLELLDLKAKPLSSLAVMEAAKKTKAKSAAPPANQPRGRQSPELNSDVCDDIYEVSQGEYEDQPADIRLNRRLQASIFSDKSIKQDRLGGVKLGSAQSEDFDSVDGLQRVIKKKSGKPRLSKTKSTFSKTDNRNIKAGLNSALGGGNKRASQSYTGLTKTGSKLTQASSVADDLKQSSQDSTDKIPVKGSPKKRTASPGRKSPGPSLE